MKKTLALLLCALLTLALVPVVAIPASADGPALAEELPTVVYVKDGGEGDGSSAANAVGTLTAAYQALDLSKDCTVVVCGVFSQSTTFSFGTTPYEGSVKITSKYGGEDYTATASLDVKDCRFVLWGATVFDDITINLVNKFYLVIAQFHPFTLGENVTINKGPNTTGAAFDRGFSILGGYQNGQNKDQYSTAPKAANVEVYSGDYIIIGAYNRQLANFDCSNSTSNVVVGGSAVVYGLYNCATNVADLKGGDVTVTLQDNAEIKNLATAINTGNVTSSFTLNWLGGSIGSIRLTNGFNYASPVPDGVTEETVYMTYTNGTKLIYNDATEAAANFTTVSGLFDAKEKAGSAKIEVPTRPVLTSEKVFYMAFTGADSNDGLTKSTAKKTWGKLAAENGSGITSLLDEGGTVVAVGKSYVGDNYTLPDFGGNTVLFTAKDTDGTSYLSDATSQLGNILGHTGSKAANVFTFTMTGNVIFENIGLLNRNPAAAGDTFTFKVAEGAKVVVGTGVVLQNVDGGYAVPKLVVDEGGYAFLDVVGFSSYTGTGTIILNNDLAEQINVAETFAGFEGIVADETGNVLLGAAAQNPAPGTTPVTGSATVVVAAIALLASFGAIVALKKKEER